MGPTSMFELPRRIASDAFRAGRKGGPSLGGREGPDPNLAVFAARRDVPTRGVDRDARRRSGLVPCDPCRVRSCVLSYVPDLGRSEEGPARKDGLIAMTP